MSRCDCVKLLTVKAAPVRSSAREPSVYMKVKSWCRCLYSRKTDLISTGVISAFDMEKSRLVSMSLKVQKGTKGGTVARFGSLILYVVSARCIAMLIVG